MSDNSLISTSGGDYERPRPHRYTIEYPGRGDTINTFAGDDTFARRRALNTARRLPGTEVTVSRDGWSHTSIINEGEKS